MAVLIPVDNRKGISFKKKIQTCGGAVVIVVTREEGKVALVEAKLITATASS